MGQPHVAAAGILPISQARSPRLPAPPAAGIGITAVSGYGPHGTGTWPGPVTRLAPGCTRCCGLVPGGIRREISAWKAARILERATPSGPAAQARCGLANEFLADLRRLDAQLGECHQKLAAAVKPRAPA